MGSDSLLSPNPQSQGSSTPRATMDASRFLASKSFIQTLDLAPSFRLRSSPVIFRRRLGAEGHASAITCCTGSRRPQLPEDGHEPSIESDWRSFRARLVAGEQASLAPNAGGGSQLFTAPPPPVGDKWAHPLHEPERGCLLIATEKLDGVHIFERTVILLLSAGPLGPTGVILNRPSLMSIKEARSIDADIAGTFTGRPLFFGGPMEESLFLVGPQEGGEDDGVGKSGVFEEVMKGVYYGTKESIGCAAEMVKRSVVGVGDFRFFDGCCGWEKEQLREEIREGYWKVVACSPSVVGLTSMGSVGLWEEVLGLVGGRKVW